MIKLPLVGPAYKMQAQSMSCQNCINWYPQTIEYPNGSRVAALMPTPGLKKIFQGVTSAVRGLHVLSNGALLAVIGNKLYHSKANKFDLTEIGSISALGTVRFADNGRVALIVNGTYTYSFDLKKLTLTRLSGSAIPRSTHVVFLDGRFVFNKANTGQFHWSDLYSTNVNALSYATAESTPDNVTAIIEFNSTELWLFGSQSVERYYGTGSANAPFSRLSGGAMSFGCLAPDSIVSLSTGVIWLGVSEFGGSQIVMSAGGIPERISTHALEEEIASFSKTTDAMAYAYQMEGHVFYVISFPSANVTFCFDVSTGLWHQRSFANVQGLHERHRSQHHAYFNNIHIVGDYRNGKLYQLDNNIFTDDGELILRERTAQAVITDQKLTRFNQLQIICETGFYGVVKKEDPEPSEISCEGATQSIVIHGYARILESGEEHVQLTETVKLNGSVIKDVPSFILFESIDQPIMLPPEGYYWTGSRRATNTSNQNVRIEHTYTPVGQKDFKMFTAENPTVINEFEENGRLAYCLEGKSAPSISCDGATLIILFEPAPLFNGEIEWIIEFDGVAYNLGKVNGNEIISSLPNVIKEKTHTDWDGFWVLENKDTLPHRFKLTPSSKPEIDPKQAPWAGNNPTFMLSENGSFVFCLAGIEPVYPPYAVVKTSASWGDTFPAQITVNGKQYTGDLYGNLADILAHQYNIYTGLERLYADFEGQPDLVRVVFAGDVFAENIDIDVIFLSDISIGADDSFSYPYNETLQFDGNKASFKIGKLVCDIKVDQSLTIHNSNYKLVYGQVMNFNVGDRIGVNVLTDRVAGAGIEDPTDYCSTAASPESCIQGTLLNSLVEQWNPELKVINLKASWSGLSRAIMPLNASDDKGINDPYATAKMVIQPSQLVELSEMYFLGYAIPTCYIPS